MSTTKQPRRCAICGRFIQPHRGAGRPRQQHYECGQLSFHLDAVATLLLERVRFAEGLHGDTARRRLRSRLTTLGNQFLQWWLTQRSDRLKDFLPRPRRPTGKS